MIAIPDKKILDRKITAFASPVSSLPDRPQLSAEELKAVFDSNTTNELKAAVNGVIDDLAGPDGAASIGYGGSTVAEMALFKDNEAPFTPSAPFHPATKAYVDEKVLLTGAADMTQAVYDPDGDGAVADSDCLGGQPPSYYARSSLLSRHVENPVHFLDVTHSKDGAVHTLSGWYGEMYGAVTVRFEASAAYAYGDGFSLYDEENGLAWPLTARLVNGQELPDGFFAAGSIMTAELSLEGKQAFFKSGGMPAGVYANHRFFAANDTFTVPKTGKYHIVCAGSGGDGGTGDSGTDSYGDAWWAMGGSGGSGGVAVKDMILAAGQVIAVTAGAGANASFGSYCTAVRGGNGGNGGYQTSSPAGGSAGFAGSASGGDVNYPGRAGTAGSANWDNNGSSSPIQGALSSADTELTSSAVRCRFGSWDTFGVMPSGFPMCSEGAGADSTSGSPWNYNRGAIGGVLAEWN